MDNSFELFHERIIDAIRSGEVVCLFFPRLGKTLILDLRQTPEVPPEIFLDDMVSSPRERLESLQALRPQFPLPDELRLAPWFGFVRSLRDTGVREALLERCEQTGHAMLPQQCRDALHALEQIETKLVRAIVRGEMSRTLWQRQG